MKTTEADVANNI